MLNDKKGEGQGGGSGGGSGGTGEWEKCGKMVCRLTVSAVRCETMRSLLLTGHAESM